MKVKYKILYKNGFEEEITQEGPEKDLAEMNKVMYEAIEKDMEGVLSLGDREHEGNLIRIGDISRINIQVIS
ncbi:hypothetical protein [Cytobacillus horneckiae]|uniref:hypothetical protein n=1 Tax=Cytobacillus horneckiae TaxID=549687 RepID=UPI003D9A7011